MSCDCQLIDSNIFISKKDSKKILSIIKDEVKNTGPRIRTVEEAFDYIGLEIEYDDELNIVKFINNDCGLSAEIFLRKISHLIKPGSYITMSDDEGNMWRWVFIDNIVRTIEPKISWD